jgi:hypothetical protein
MIQRIYLKLHICDTMTEFVLIRDMHKITKRDFSKKKNGRIIFDSYIQLIYSIERNQTFWHDVSIFSTYPTVNHTCIHLMVHSFSRFYERLNWPWNNIELISSLMKYLTCRGTPMSDKNVILNNYTDRGKKISLESLISSSQTLMNDVRME